MLPKRFSQENIPLDISDWKFKVLQMNVIKIIELMGGRKTVSGLIGMAPQYVSQMRSQHRFADHHLRFFIALRPELEWPVLLGDDYGRFESLINDESLKRLSAARRRKPNAL